MLHSGSVWFGGWRKVFGDQSLFFRIILDSFGFLQSQRGWREEPKITGGARSWSLRWARFSVQTWSWGPACCSGSTWAPPSPWGQPWGQSSSSHLHFSSSSVRSELLWSSRSSGGPRRSRVWWLPKIIIKAKDDDYCRNIFCAGWLPASFTVVK